MYTKTDKVLRSLTSQTPPSRFRASSCCVGPPPPALFVSYCSRRTQTKVKKKPHRFLWKTTPDRSHAISKDVLLYRTQSGVLLDGIWTLLGPNCTTINILLGMIKKCTKKRFIENIYNLIFIRIFINQYYVWQNILYVEFLFLSAKTSKVL